MCSCVDTCWGFGRHMGGSIMVLFNFGQPNETIYLKQEQSQKEYRIPNSQAVSHRSPLVASMQPPSRPSNTIFYPIIPET